MRLMDANAFSAFLKDAVIKHKYDRLNIDNTLTVADVFQSVCAELDGTGLEGFKNAPTVDAVPVRHGRWRHYEGMLICSECGGEFYDDIMEWCGDHVPKFCPECGADMREDGDNEKAD